MQLRSLPFAASAVAGRSFLAAIPRPVTERRKQICCNAGNSSSEKEGSELSTAEEALRRLAELDAQLEGLKEPKMRPPPPPPPPDPFMDRDMIIQRGRPSDELPEMTPAYVTFSTLAIFILTIFTNVVFNVYIKPSVDGADQPVRIQRVPLADPSFQQPGNSSDSS
ncbi:hypothetical protein CFC21_016336 [Triticum aestivum]|uniref:Uncharacterized protein n=3 Tax=Triticum TaxID=4564 RepID=A0A9R1NPQ5_TRITD|nr:uncharacterized protein LOC119354083 [Triticum dicoccoides]XP_044456181.1 uncharacterized protein LOC123188209 [Triticum aestivum]KAF7000422.1 hypothetical protein CFC21_016336 [Triticum aestivum]VAH28801.1 unnamed protein product [Triticum turgidum subsp. durum]